jgi:hypothetical protein
MRALSRTLVRTRGLRPLLFCTLGGLLVIGSLSSAQADPVWSSVSYTPFGTMQGLNADATKAWAVPTVGDEQAYKLRGVVLNNPADMLDSTPNYNTTTPWYMGGQWQIFVAAASAVQDPSQPSNLVGDYGGAALWIGQNYGNHGMYSGNPNRAEYCYTNAEWLSEVQRLEYPVGLAGQPVTEPLRAGDLVEIRARGGLFYKGKFNVNEQHDNDPIRNFDVVVLARDVDLTPTDLELSTVKDASNNWYSSADRTLAANPEHYQATLVRLQDMTLASGTWAPNASITIQDSQGRTIPALVGLDPAFSGVAPTGTFDVVGIFDQEPSSWDGSHDPLSGYRLWIVDAGQFGAAAGVPEPSALALVLAGIAVVAVASRRGSGRTRGDDLA